MSILDDIIEEFTYTKGHQPTLKILSDKVIQKSPHRKEITQWSIDHVYNSEDYPMGSWDSKDFGNLRVVAQIQKHTWSHDKTGKKITGNFRGITLYELK